MLNIVSQFDSRAPHGRPIPSRRSDTVVSDASAAQTSARLAGYPLWQRNERSSAAAGPLKSRDVMLKAAKVFVRRQLLAPPAEIRTIRSNIDLATICNHTAAASAIKGLPATATDDLVSLDDEHENSIKETRKPRNRLQRQSLATSRIPRPNREHRHKLVRGNDSKVPDGVDIEAQLATLEDIEASLADAKLIEHADRISRYRAGDLHNGPSGGWCADCLACGRRTHLPSLKTWSCDAYIRAFLWLRAWMTHSQRYVRFLQLASDDEGPGSQKEHDGNNGLGGTGLLGAALDSCGSCLQARTGVVPSSCCSDRTASAASASASAPAPLATPMCFGPSDYVQLGIGVAGTVRMRTGLTCLLLGLWIVSLPLTGVYAAASNALAMDGSRSSSRTVDRRFDDAAVAGGLATQTTMQRQMDRRHSWAAWSGASLAVALEWELEVQVRSDMLRVSGETDQWFSDVNTCQIEGNSSSVGIQHIAGLPTFHSNAAQSYLIAITQGILAIAMLAAAWTTALLCSRPLEALRSENKSDCRTVVPDRWDIRSRRMEVHATVLDKRSPLGASYVNNPDDDLVAGACTTSASSTRPRVEVQDYAVRIAGLDASVGLGTLKRNLRRATGCPVHAAVLLHREASTAAECTERLERAAEAKWLQTMAEFQSERQALRNKHGRHSLASLSSSQEIEIITALRRGGLELEELKRCDECIASAVEQSPQGRGLLLRQAAVSMVASSAALSPPVSSRYADGGAEATRLRWLSQLASEPASAAPQSAQRGHSSSSGSGRGMHDQTAWNLSGKGKGKGRSTVIASTSISIGEMARQASDYAVEADEAWEAHRGTGGGGDSESSGSESDSTDRHAEGNRRRDGQSAMLSSMISTTNSSSMQSSRSIRSGISGISEVDRDAISEGSRSLAWQGTAEMLALSLPNWIQSFCFCCCCCCRRTRGAAVEAVILFDDRSGVERALELARLGLGAQLVGRGSTIAGIPPTVEAVPGPPHGIIWKHVEGPHRETWVRAGCRSCWDPCCPGIPLRLRGDERRAAEMARLKTDMRTGLRKAQVEKNDSISNTHGVAVQHEDEEDAWENEDDATVTAYSGQCWPCMCMSPSQTWQAAVWEGMVSWLEQQSHWIGLLVLGTAVVGVGFVLAGRAFRSAGIASASASHGFQPAPGSLLSCGTELRSDETHSEGAGLMISRILALDPLWDIALPTEIEFHVNRTCLGGLQAIRRAASVAVLLGNAASLQLGGRHGADGTTTPTCRTYDVAADRQIAWPYVSALLVWAVPWLLSCASVKTYTGVWRSHRTRALHACSLIAMILVGPGALLVALAGAGSSTATSPNTEQSDLLFGIDFGSVAAYASARWLRAYLSNITVLTIAVACYDVGWTWMRCLGNTIWDHERSWFVPWGRLVRGLGSCAWMHGLATLPDPKYVLRGAEKKDAIELGMDLSASRDHDMNRRATRGGPKSPGRGAGFNMRSIRRHQMHKGGEKGASRASQVGSIRMRPTPAGAKRRTPASVASPVFRQGRVTHRSARQAALVHETWVDEDADTMQGVVSSILPTATVPMREKKEGKSPGSTIASHLHLTGSRHSNGRRGRISGKACRRYANGKGLRRRGQQLGNRTLDDDPKGDYPSMDESKDQHIAWPKLEDGSVGTPGSALKEQSDRDEAVTSLDDAFILHAMDAAESGSSGEAIQHDTNPDTPGFISGERTGYHIPDESGCGEGAALDKAASESNPTSKEIGVRQIAETVLDKGVTASQADDANGDHPPSNTSFPSDGLRSFTDIITAVRAQQQHSRATTPPPGQSTVGEEVHDREVASEPAATGDGTHHLARSTSRSEPAPQTHEARGTNPRQYCLECQLAVLEWMLLFRFCGPHGGYQTILHPEPVGAPALGDVPSFVASRQSLISFMLFLGLSHAGLHPSLLLVTAAYVGLILATDIPQLLHASRGWRRWTESEWWHTAVISGRVLRVAEHLSGRLSSHDVYAALVGGKKKKQADKRRVSQISQSMGASSLGQTVAPSGEKANNLRRTIDDLDVGLRKPYVQRMLGVHANQGAWLRASITDRDALLTSPALSMPVPAPRSPQGEGNRVSRRDASSASPEPKRALPPQGHTADIYPLHQDYPVLQQIPATGPTIRMNTDEPQHLDLDLFPDQHRDAWSPHLLDLHSVPEHVSDGQAAIDLDGEASLHAAAITMGLLVHCVLSAVVGSYPAAVPATGSIIKSDEQRGKSVDRVSDSDTVYSGVGTPDIMWTPGAEAAFPDRLAQAHMLLMMPLLAGSILGALVLVVSFWCYFRCSICSQTAQLARESARASRSGIANGRRAFGTTIPAIDDPTRVSNTRSRNLRLGVATAFGAVRGTGTYLPQDSGTFCAAYPCLTETQLDRADSSLAAGASLFDLRAKRRAKRANSRRMGRVLRSMVDPGGFQRAVAREEESSDDFDQTGHEQI